MEDKTIEVCKCLIIHEELVETAKKNMLDEELIKEIGDFFKIFADPTRIKIIQALFQSEMCVCDIAAVINMKQSAISHQLSLLKQTRLVKYRKTGKIVYYSLNDEHIKLIYEMGLAHIKEKKE